MLRMDELRKAVWKVSALGILALLFQGILATAVEAQEAGEKKVIVGTYDEEAAFRKHPAYAEVAKAYDAAQAAQHDGDAAAVQKARKRVSLERQKAEQRFRADLAKGLPKAAAAAGVHVVALHLVYTSDRVVTKDITPLLVRTLTGAEIRGAPPGKSGNADAAIGTYDPQALFQKHPRYDELIAAITDLRKAQEQGDRKAAMDAQRVFEQKRDQINREFQKDVGEVLPTAAEGTGVDAIAIQVPFASEEVERRDVTPVLAKALAKSGDNADKEDTQKFPPLR